MKKVNICVEIEKDGRGIYFGHLHRDDDGRLYAKIPSPLGPPTLTLVENLQNDGYTVTMVKERNKTKGQPTQKKKKGGKKKHDAARTARMHE